MTDNIQKKFFDTFGIEPKEKIRQTFNGAEFKVETTKEYPQITDRILLRLICLLSSEFGDKLNIKTLKKRMMQESMCCYTFKGKLNEKFKQKVRTLFKEYE